MLLTVACYAEAGQEGEPSMTVHFTSEELAERRRRALEAMAVRGLDALLMFKQESVASKTAANGLSEDRATAQVTGQVT
jgi:hypothetical protein